MSANLHEFLKELRLKLLVDNRSTGFDPWVINLKQKLDKLAPAYYEPFPDLPFNTSVGDELRYWLINNWNTFEDCERVELLCIADDIDRRYRAEEQRHREEGVAKMRYYGKYHHVKPHYDALVKSFDSLFQENQKLKEEVNELRAAQNKQDTSGTN